MSDPVNTTHIPRGVLSPASTLSKKRHRGSAVRTSTRPFEGRCRSAQLIRRTLLLCLPGRPSFPRCVCVCACVCACEWVSGEAASGNKRLDLPASPLSRPNQNPTRPRAATQSDLSELLVATEITEPRPELGPTPRVRAPGLPAAGAPVDDRGSRRRSGRVTGSAEGRPG